MAVGASEAETFWTEFLRALARRGLRGVKLVTSDAHEGLKAAAARVLHASWQRCRVHFMRNVLAHAGKPTVAVSSPPFPRRRAGVALTSVPKFARLFAGENWIRNFSSVLPSVVLRVSEIRDPGSAAISRRDNAAMGPNSVSPSPQPRSDSYGLARRDARGLFVRLFLPG